MSSEEYRSTQMLRDMLALAAQYSPAKMKAYGYFIMVPTDTKLRNNMSGEFVTPRIRAKLVWLQPVGKPWHW
jgi:hypothetical protein